MAIADPSAYGPATQRAMGNFSATSQPAPPQQPQQMMQPQRPPQQAQQQPPPQPPPPPEDLSQSEKNQLSQLKNGLSSADQEVFQGNLFPHEGEQYKSMIQKQLAPLMAKQQTFTAYQQQEAQKQVMQATALQESMEAQHKEFRAKSFQKTVGSFVDPLSGETEHFVQDQKGDFKPIEFKRHTSREEREDKLDEMSINAQKEAAAASDLLSPSGNNEDPNQPKPQKRFDLEGAVASTDPMAGVGQSKDRPAATSATPSGVPPEDLNASPRDNNAPLEIPDKTDTPSETPAIPDIEDFVNQVIRPQTSGATGSGAKPASANTPIGKPPTQQQPGQQWHDVRQGSGQVLAGQARTPQEWNDLSEAQQKQRMIQRQGEHEEAEAFRRAKQAIPIPDTTGMSPAGRAQVMLQYNNQLIGHAHKTMGHLEDWKARQAQRTEDRAGLQQQRLDATKERQQATDAASKQKQDEARAERVEKERVRVAEGQEADRKDAMEHYQKRIDHHEKSMHDEKKQLYTTAMGITDPVKREKALKDIPGHLADADTIAAKARVLAQADTKHMLETFGRGGGSGAGGRPGAGGGTPQPPAYLLKLTKEQQDREKEKETPRTESGAVDLGSGGARTQGPPKPGPRPHFYTVQGEGKNRKIVHHGDINQEAYDYAVVNGEDVTDARVVKGPSGTHGARSQRPPRDKNATPPEEGWLEKLSKTFGG